jgi:thiol-disulfide isomerase/thioredoxin
MCFKLAGIVCTLFLCLPVHAEVPEQLTPLDASGLRAELNELDGRVILVNFWATWCRPCLEEIPTLVKLEAELHDQGFSLVAVSLDEPDSDDVYIKNFMDQRFPGFSSYRSLERYKDNMVSVIDPAWNEILPTTYLLARDGSVARRIQGALSHEEFTREILKLLE